MSSNLITQPYGIILDPTGGGGRAKPVANGKYYVGIIDLDPVANPRTDLAYKDESGTERPLTSPLILNNSGAFVVSENDGTLIQPYMKQGLGHSVLITDKRGKPVYSDDHVGDSGNIDGAIMENIAKYTNIAYKASPGKSAIENMIIGDPIKSSIGDQCEADGSFFIKISDSNGDIRDYLSLGPIHTSSFGATGDRVTDDTSALNEAIQAAKVTEADEIIFNGTHGSSFLIAPDRDGVVMDVSGVTYNVNNTTFIKTPNGLQTYAILTLRNLTGFTLNGYGCTLIGDRYEHDYSEPGTHEGGMCIRVEACRQGEINGFYNKWATGDGLYFTTGKATYPINSQGYSPGGYNPNGTQNNSLPGYRTQNKAHLMSLLHTGDEYFFWMRNIDIIPELKDARLIAFYYDAGGNFLESVNMTVWECERKVADDHPDASYCELWMPDVGIDHIPAGGDRIHQPGVGRRLCSNITVKDCVFDNNRRMGGTHTGSTDIKWVNCTFKETRGVAPEAGVDIENSFNLRINFDNCLFQNNKFDFVNVSGQDVTLANCKIRNIQDTSYSAPTFTAGNRAESRMINTSFYNVSANFDGVSYASGCDFNQCRIAGISQNATVEGRYCVFDACDIRNSIIQLIGLWKDKYQLSDCRVDSLTSIQLENGLISGCTLKDFNAGNTLNTDFKSCRITVESGSTSFSNNSIVTDCDITSDGTNNGGVLPDITSGSSGFVMKGCRVQTKGVTDTNGHYFFRAQNEAIIEGNSFSLNHNTVGSFWGNIFINGDNVKFIDNKVIHYGTGNTILGVNSSKSNLVISSSYIEAVPSRTASFIGEVGTSDYKLVKCVLNNVGEPGAAAHRTIVDNSVV